jgi:hypothetical protein
MNLSTLRVKWVNLLEEREREREVSRNFAAEKWDSWDPIAHLSNFKRFDLGVDKLTGY